MLFVGCQQGLDVAAPDTPWTVHKSSNQSLQFELPEGMSRTDRSASPEAFLYQDGAGDFAISVMHGTDGASRDFPASMIAISLEGCTKLGETKEFSRGSS